jgi:protein TonB
VKPEVPVAFVEEQQETRKSARKAPKATPAQTVKKRQKPVKKAGSGTANKQRASKSATKPATTKTASGRAGSAGRAGQASAGDNAAYARRVLSHIQRYKRFPSGASSGKVGLKVQISASGALLSATVRKSSGNRVLDQAALATARRASPYPKPPANRGFSFTVSLRYAN